MKINFIFLVILCTITFRFNTLEVKAQVAGGGGGTPHAGFDATQFKECTSFGRQAAENFKLTCDEAHDQNEMGCDQATGGLKECCDEYITALLACCDAVQCLDPGSGDHEAYVSCVNDATNTFKLCKAGL